MGAPFSYTPHFRVTPPAGPPLDFNIAAMQWPVVVLLNPELVQEVQELVTREVVSTRYGTRLHVVIQVEVPAGSADEASLATLCGLMARDDYLVELTLNFGAQTQEYREVTLESSYARTLVDGKNVNAVYAFNLVCRKLLTEQPAGNPKGPAPLVSNTW